jgi:drug/metabolite transporter (DMT)-like permease
VKAADGAELVTLAAIWGASFLFMRMGAGEFGPVALAFVRVAGATAFLLPLLAWRGQLGALRSHWKPILLVGITNSAIPFVCFGLAVLAITGGLSAIFNATTPLFGALIAWLWLKDRLSASRAIGLGIGFAGVVWLAWDKASIKTGDAGVSSALAIAACLLATLLYGFSANFTKRYLQGVSSLALATGSQLSATLFLALPAIGLWPSRMPGAASWIAAALLALMCTGVAYVLYFRLIAHVGPSNAISVTFLVPAFAVLWGAVFLHEAITGAMVIGCAIILLGTSLATGLLKWPRTVPG